MMTHPIELNQKMMSHYVMDASQSKSRIFPPLLFPLKLPIYIFYQFWGKKFQTRMVWLIWGIIPLRSNKVKVIIFEKFRPLVGQSAIPSCHPSGVLHSEPFIFLDTKVLKFTRARFGFTFIYWVYSFRKPSPDWLKRSTRSYYWPIRSREF